MLSLVSSQQFWLFLMRAWLFLWIRCSFIWTEKHTLGRYGNFTETNESIQSVLPHAMPAIDTSLNDWFNSDCRYEYGIAQSLDSWWEKTWDCLQASILPWLSKCFQNHYLAARLSQLPLSKDSRSDIFLFTGTNIQWIADSCHRTKSRRNKSIYTLLIFPLS